jgi:hypothetical protein
MYFSFEHPLVWIIVSDQLFYVIKILNVLKGSKKIFYFYLSVEGKNVLNISSFYNRHNKEY